ncbi:polyamine aminopropyltransferase [Flavobacteriales bacterium]|nr:polyamine aminopropyltransferase [Flavobacteriales bacterium]
MSALGNHILVEFTGCSPEILNDVSLIERLMNKAAEKADATIINSTFHHFSPIGVSGVVVIQESHLAIHSWPEYGYAAVDLFTCGDEINPWISFDFLKEEFGAENYSALEMNRGSLSLLSRLDVNLESLRSSIKNKTVENRFERNLWFTDKDDDQALSIRYNGNVLYREKSAYQTVSVIDTYKYGKMLTLDKMVMTTEKDEFHYHEMISHPALFLHGKAKNVLVIGGGDGGTVREILRHDAVDNLTMVEIDGLVIDACKEHLPTIASAFDHPKLNLIVGDGLDFVAQSKEKYDIIFCDNSDPVGPSEGLFSHAFYNQCHNLLCDEGIFVVQGETPNFNRETFIDINKTIKKVFGDDRAAISFFPVPTYPTGYWSFQYGFKSDRNPKLINENAVNDFSLQEDLQYYNSDIHIGSFALPNYIKKLIS